MPEISADLAAFATAELRHRGIEVRTGHDGRADLGRLGRAVRRRGRPVPHRRLDRRRAPGTRSSPSSACRSTRTAGSWSTATARSRAATTCGRSATPPRCPIPPGPGQPTPPTCQHALRQGRTVGRQRRRRARRRPAEAVHLQDARRVRRHGPPEGGGGDARHQVARVPGLVPGPHLPPVHDAGHQAASCAWSSTGRWTSLFGRDTSELGQLGHPPVLETQTAGESSADAPPAVRR